MKRGWAIGLKAAAIAALLAVSGTAAAQAPDAAPAAQAPTTAAAISETAAAHSAAQTDANAFYERMAPTPGIGQPRPKGINLQEPMTPIAEEAQWLVHYMLNPVMFGISIFVLGLLLYVVWRYRAAANPVPSKTTHNLQIEIIWTLVPALVLLVIAFPSFRLLANQYDPPKADITIKATGYQWYWGYEYPDYGGISFDSVPLTKAEATAEKVPYLLDVDNRLVVPAGKTVKILVTAADVLHSFAVPAFWVKMDAVPGKLNETWFKVDRPGVYYGQCSELCGTKHGYMPITVEVLPEEKFRAWVRMKQRADGIDPTGPGIALATTPVSPAAAAAAVRAAITPAGAPQIIAPANTVTPAPVAAPAA